MMNKYVLLLMSILSFLFGCGNGTPYHKKDGDWFYDDLRMSIPSSKPLTPLNKRFAKDAETGYYRGSGISGSDGGSFEALSDHYAKDKKTVYYCDTYRKGQEYYFFKHNSIQEIDSAHAPSFLYLDADYGRDKANVFFEGKRIRVRDVSSYEVLDYGFAKDRISGYYFRYEIEGSDGASFARIDNLYSKDRNHVYYSNTHIEGGTNSVPPYTFIVEGCSPATFSALDDGYALSGRNAYYNGKIISNQADSLHVLSAGYAKTGKEVYCNGKLIKGADSFSFDVLSPPTEQANAKDKNGEYYDGRKVK